MGQDVSHEEHNISQTAGNVTSGSHLAAAFEQSETNSQGLWPLKALSILITAPMLQLNVHLHGPPSQEGSPLELRPVDLSASEVIERWATVAYLYAEKAESGLARIDIINALARGSTGKEKFLQKMHGTITVLKMMEDKIERIAKRSTSHQVLALATKANVRQTDLPSNMLAMALVSQDLMYDFSGGKLENIIRRQGLKKASGLVKGGLVPVVHIAQVVATPMLSIPGGLGKQLLLQIVRRAAASGHLVLLRAHNMRLAEYYQSIGFELLYDRGHEQELAEDMPEMVYSELLSGATGHELLYEMVSLQFD